MATPSAIPHALADRWSLEHFELIADTRTSLVHRVLRSDGRPAILKQLKPTGLHELPGISFLGWRNGHGAVRLLEHCENICLLEDAGSRTLRDHRLSQGEKACNDIIVAVLRNLHSPSAHDVPTDLLPLQRHFRALLERPNIADERLSEALSYCAATAKELVLTQSDIRPLHGDLHHENIVSGTSRDWLAIDPQGLVGDAVYEVANVFGNPTGAFADIVDPDRIIGLARLFASALDCSEEKILRYAIAHAGLSICWSLEDGDGHSAGSNAAERLAFIDVARRLLEHHAISS